MARAVRPSTAWTEATAVGYGTGDETYTTGMLVPGVGATILRWGFLCTAVTDDKGNDTLTATIFERGVDNTVSNFLGESIALTGADEVVVGDGFVGDGTALMASAGKCATLGNRLAISFDVGSDGNDDLFTTESATFSVWALWQL